MAALKAMLANYREGIGLFQGTEFIFQKRTWAQSAKAIVALRRLLAVSG